MWEINLVRYRLKSFKKGKIAKLLIYGEILLFLITLLILSGRYFHISYEIEQAEESLESSQEKFIDLSEKQGAKGGNIEEIKKEWKRSSDKLSLINAIMGERILWASKLQAVAESIPSNIYLKKIYASVSEKEIEGKKVKILVVEGSVLASTKDALPYINEFINQLGKNHLLKEQISRIERPFVSKPKFTEDQKEFLDFKLFCYLK